MNSLESVEQARLKEQEIRQQLEDARRGAETRLSEAGEVGMEQHAARAAPLPEVRGFDKSGVIGDAELQHKLARDFPSEHVAPERITAIEYSDAYKGDGEGYVAGTCYTSGDNVSRVEINRQCPEGCMSRDDLCRTVAHEVGHNVHYNLPREQWARWEQLNATSRPDQCVSNYAKTNAYEDFAESYAEYQHDPELLREVHSGKYEFMRTQVYRGREYEV